METTFSNRTYQVLRIAVAMCFIGHGAFGIITKQVWCNYFAVFGIGEHLAYQLMPVVGIVDIALGLMMLIYPVRAIAAWLVVWGLLTASLRPLSGEPVAELFERAGNFGAPICLLLLVGFPNSLKGWFKKIDFNEISLPSIRQVEIALRVVVFLLLAGHGWLNLIEKKGLLNQYQQIGIQDAVLTARIIGGFEILSALIVLVKPVRSFLMFLFIWKMTSELLYPKYEIFEWIERGGSYGAILAFWMIKGIAIKNTNHSNEHISTDLAIEPDGLKKLSF